ncbi:hypothetical protein BDV96DRAFT_591027 [Lophiotrema nucula]|uniref:Myb-like domain-containing protein n=1 Tax=Lophiotrema nucula TaxID=690887 RepID=A0A6A5YK19_9PLEO|nr:hypothetical protein BDV96DRAFT_591027 [Lophiotrema nucula]
MEPRIATLLGSSALSDRSRRPLPVEPTPAGDEAAETNHSRHDGHAARSSYGVQGPRSQKSSVPIAEVLNNEAPSRHEPQAQAQAQPPAPGLQAQPFSGRLSDILLDPEQQYANKRRKLDNQSTPPAPPAPSGAENSLLKLPKLPQLPKKSTKRPRIPPLIQGLHQPPPLPAQGRLFPPITGEADGFGRDIGERVTLRSPAVLEQNKGNAKTSEGPQTVSRKPSRAEADRARPAPGIDKENQSQESVGTGTDKGDGKSKELKRRNMWSDQETKDLLQGASRFGIGNWKKILYCPDYTFNSRTTVDLKDRFRTCCPGEGLKLRKPRSKAAVAEDAPKALVESFSSTTTSQDGPSQASSFTEPSPRRYKLPRKQRADTHKKTSAELAAMGIDKPFFKKKRRERRQFTDEDDANLLKGFLQHGPVWHVIRSDAALGLDTRQPTDLRDRFRIRYPDKYAKAGYKLKPKAGMILKEKEGDTGQETATTETQKVHSRETETDRAQASVAQPSMPAPALRSSIGNLRSHTLLQPSISAFAGSFDDDLTDVNSEDEGDGPITLNRNIFEWADANPAQASATTGPASTQNTTIMASDFGFNMFGGMDGMHINPLVTLNPQTSSLSSTMPAYQNTSNSTTFTLPATSAANMGLSSTSTPAVSTSTSMAPPKQSLDSLLRTPNLPTIVFPHVPASSARSAMHNLPRPAELLSGLDFDSRPPEPSNAAFLLDDGLALGFAFQNGGNMYDSNATLAPLVNTWSGRGLLLDEPLGERSVLNSSI